MMVSSLHPQRRISISSRYYILAIITLLIFLRALRDPDYKDITDANSTKAKAKIDGKISDLTSTSWKSSNNPVNSKPPSFLPWTFIDPSFHRPSPSSNDKNNNNTPTLVILMGNLRCGELAWRSLYDNLLDYNVNVDLALILGEDVVTSPMLYSNASLFSRAKYVIRFREYGTDWSPALDMINPRWKTTIAPLLSDTSIALGGVNYANWHGSGAITFWIRWFISQQILQRNWTRNYDRFIITRTDHYYKCPHDLSQLDPSYLWVPFGQDFGGITDRHWVVPSKYVLDALNILPGLFESRNPLREYPLLSSNDYNPERLVLDRWKQQGLAQYVRRFPRNMFTCGNPIAEDTTRWKQAKGEIVTEGVRKKYRKEYLQSQETCSSNATSDGGGGRL